MQIKEKGGQVYIKLLISLLKNLKNRGFKPKVINNTTKFVKLC